MITKKICYYMCCLAENLLTWSVIKTVDIGRHCFTSLVEMPGKSCRPVFGNALLAFLKYDL